MSTFDRLQQVRAWYAHSLGEAFREATAIEEPAGSSPSWAALCQRAGVALVSETERQQIRAAQNPTRGAPLMEFQAVVDAIVLVTRREHAGLRQFNDERAERLWDQMRGAIEETQQDMLKAYRAAVLPKRAGGMFANATAHVATHKPAMQGAGSATLTCRHCGAPQLQAGVFDCKYCGNRMVG